MPQRDSTRRDFLKGAATLGAGFAVNALGCAAGLRTITSPERAGKLVVDTADIEELAAVGGAVQINGPGLADPLILVRTGDTDYNALAPLCTHLGCRVRKTRFGFRCPCHGSAFDFNGQVVNGPANEPLPTYTVIISGTIVTIEL